MSTLQMIIKHCHVNARGAAVVVKDTVCPAHMLLRSHLIVGTSQETLSRLQS